jgi:hypothetical protein
VFRRARDFDRRTYRRRRMGGRYGETYIIAERPVVFPPQDYCGCLPKPGCIPGPAPCDFAGLRRPSNWSPATRRSTTVGADLGAAPPSDSKVGMVIGVATVGFLFAVAMSSKPEPGMGR